MSKMITRENLQKFKVSAHRPKNVQSQSPPHKQLLKKIENAHTSGTKKYEVSLQDNSLHSKKNEEPEDFRVEIERRFWKSESNKHYVFPLHDNSDEFESDSESSMSSLKHVTVYNLCSQNQKREAHSRRVRKSNTIDFQNHYKVGSGYVRSGKADNVKDEQAIDVQDHDDTDDDAPIEVRIRDKNSTTYMRLMRLLENTAMLSHNSAKSQSKPATNRNQVFLESGAQDEPTDVDPAKHCKNEYDQSGKQNEHFTNFTTQASTGDVHKSHASQVIQPAERQYAVEHNPKVLRHSQQGIRKAQSQEKVRLALNSSSFLDKSLGASNHGSSKG